MKTFILLVVLLGGAGLYFVFRPLPIGGLSSRYTAQPQDPFLTIQAVTAKPIIQAARQLMATHGRAPTEDELKTHLTQKSIQAQPPQDGWIAPTRNGPFGAWLYFPKEKGFILYLKLGWDPTLLYEESANDQCQWIFDPGDGSDEQKLDLKIGA